MTQTPGVWYCLGQETDQTPFSAWAILKADFEADYPSLEFPYWIEKPYWLEDDGSYDSLLAAGWKRCKHSW
jgi:hypothetical protein